MRKALLRAGLSLGVFERATGCHVGALGIHDIARATHACEFGYWVRADRRGRGYCPEASAALVSWLLSPRGEEGSEPAGFTSGMGFGRVCVFCSSANEASARVPEKLGLRFEVRQRGGYHVEGVGVTDRLGWGVTPAEWDVPGRRMKEPQGENHHGA